MSPLTYPYENYFMLKDLVATAGWILLLSSVAVVIAFRQKDIRDTRLYLYNFGFKVLFALIFALSYIIIFNGGDTLAYWDGALVIDNLLYSSPARWLEHMTSTPDQAQYYWFFNQDTGYPPIWIYKEPESYFICKLNSFLVTISFRSYLAVTVIWAFLMAHVNWKLYLAARHSKLFNDKLLPFAALFIPSVAFACAGISKDTIVFISMMIVLLCLYQFVYKRSTVRIWKIVPVFILASWILIETRGFLFGILLFAMIAGLYTYFIQKLVSRGIARVVYRILFIMAAGAALVYLLQGPLVEIINSNSYFQEAVVTQQDFKNNQYYGKNQYSLGEIELTPWGLIRVIPISILSGILEPFPWHALSLPLFVNGIESLLFIILLFRIIATGQLVNWGKLIARNELLVFCLVFVLLMAYVSGFTSIIYGVLVRIRAPLLPFWAMLIIVNLSPKTSPATQKFNTPNEPRESK